MNIGRSPAYGTFEHQTITPNGVTQTFPLLYKVGSEFGILVVINGAVKMGGVDYALADGGVNIAFTSPPANGASVFIVYLGRQLSIITPTQGLTPSMVGLGNVSNVAQVPLSYLDTDGTLTSNSDVKVASQKAVRTYVEQPLFTGWWPVNEAWTYSASYSSPTYFDVAVPTDATTRFQKGDKIKLTHAGVTKYFAVISVISNRLQLLAGDDYSLSAGAISNIFVSRHESPLGYPPWFNWTPVFTAASPMTLSTTVAAIGRVTIRGRSAEVFFNASLQCSSGTNVSASIYVTVPVPQWNVSGFGIRKPIIANVNTDEVGVWVNDRGNGRFILARAGDVNWPNNAFGSYTPHCTVEYVF